MNSIFISRKGGRKLTFRALALCRSESIGSDEGLTLETSAFQSSVDSTYPINSFKDERFSGKTSASFRLLKIYKHVTPAQTDMSTRKAASQ